MQGNSSSSVWVTRSAREPSVTRQRCAWRAGQAVALLVIALTGLFLSGCTQVPSSSKDVLAGDRAANIKACKAYASESRARLQQHLARSGLAMPTVHSQEVIGVSGTGRVSCNWAWSPDAKTANANAFAQCNLHARPVGQSCSLLMSDNALADWAIRILRDDALLSNCADCDTDVPQVPGSDGLVPYAHAKRKAPEITSRDELTYYCVTRFPTRGLVLSYGSFLSSAATFYMVDIDSKSLRRILINQPKLNPKNGQQPRIPVIWAEERVKLSPDELNPLIIRMNQIWRGGVSHKQEWQPPDLSYALILLDAGIAFQDRGTSNHAPDSVLTNDVENLVREHGSMGGSGVPTTEPCDPPPSR